MQRLERLEEDLGERRIFGHHGTLEQVVEPVRLALAGELELALGLLDEVSQRRLRREEGVGTVGLHGEDRGRLVLIGLDLDRRLALAHALLRLALDDLLRRTGRLYGDPGSAGGLQAVDLLGVALLDGEDDVLLDPVDEGRLLLALGEVTHRAEVEVEALGLHARQHAGQSVDGLVLDRDAEDLPDGHRELTAGAVDFGFVGPDDRVWREGTGVHRDDLLRVLDLLGQLVVQRLVECLGGRRAARRRSGIA